MIDQYKQVNKEAMMWLKFRKLGINWWPIIVKSVKKDLLGV